MLIRWNLTGDPLGILEPPVPQQLLSLNILIILGVSSLHESQPALQVILGPQTLLLIDVVLEPLLEHVKLLVNLVLVAVDGSLAVHGVLVQAVGVEVGLVYWILYFEIVLWEFIKEIDDEGALGLVFLKHSEYEVLQVAGVGNLERKGLLEENLVHEALVALVVEGNVQAGHVVHDHAEAEDIGAMIVCLLLDDLWAQVEWSAHLLGLQVAFFVDHGALAQVAQLDLAVLRDEDVQRLHVSMDDVVRMAMQQSQTELPSHLPDLPLGEVLSLLLLLIDKRLHIAFFRHLHGNVEALLRLLALLCGLINLLRAPLLRVEAVLVPVALLMSMHVCRYALAIRQQLQGRAVNLTVDERVVQLYDIRVLDLLHDLYLVDNVAVLLGRDVLFDSDLLECHHSVQAFLACRLVQVLLVSLVDGARGALAEDALDLEVVQICSLGC